MFLATVAFTALVGVLWEVCEYAIDGMKSGSNMQRFNNSVTNEPFVGRRALQDTMIDLMMDTLGGVLAGLYFAFTNIKGVPIKNISGLYNAGQTDLLITWLYKMCMGEVEKNYGIASVVGLMVFVIVGSFSLIMYSRSNAVKNEGDFQ